MNDTHDDLPEPDASARLITRIVERDARPADYDAFDQLASGAPSRWRELLASLRDDDVLHLALAPALDTAERVELPVPTSRGGVMRALRPWTSASGWLAAAALALLWFQSEPARSQPSHRSLAGGPGLNGPAQEGEGFDIPVDLDAGGGQLPLRLVGTEPAADGKGVDVLYWQPVLRRTRVNGVFEMAQDEHGRPSPVRVDPAVLAHHEKL
jgi:hypothetical protein